MRKFITAATLLLAIGLIPASLPAQTPGAQPDSQDKGSMAKPAVTTVTGCVAAGKKAGTFKLTADDGTVYMLKSKSANLADHVGHTVTVSGHIMTGEKKAGDAAGTPSNAADASSATGADQNSSGSGDTTANAPMRTHLMVRSLTMVSDSCKAK
jgi:hypothetical protein